MPGRGLCIDGNTISHNSFLTEYPQPLHCRNRRENEPPGAERQRLTLVFLRQMDIELRSAPRNQDCGKLLIIAVMQTSVILVKYTSNPNNDMSEPNETTPKKSDNRFTTHECLPQYRKPSLGSVFRIRLREAASLTYPKALIVGFQVPT